MLFKKKLSECVFAVNNGLPLPITSPYPARYGLSGNSLSVFEAMNDFANRDIEYEDEFGELSEEAVRSMCNRVNMEQIQRDLELVKESEATDRDALLKRMQLQQPFGRK